MLSLLGYSTIVVILVLLLANRTAAVVALAGVPVVAALVAGFSPTDIGGFVTTGLSGVVGTVALFVFAIVYFGIMRDAGMFDPIVNRLVRFAGRAPVTICLATTLLAIAAHLDGAGATTFLITIPAMLPLYDRLGMSRLVLTTCVGLGAGVMNMVPWGGPTARAATTTGISANDLWVPLIPAQVVGILTCLLIAFYLGRREAARLASNEVGEPVRVGAPPAAGSAPAAPGRAPHSAARSTTHADDVVALSEEERALRRPRLFWFNVALTVAVVATLVTTVTTPEVIFLLGVIIALLVNYPGLTAQTGRIEAHAKGAMLMATTLIAAGVFLGIIDETGMIDAMAKTAISALPGGVTPALPLVVGVLAVPMSLLFGPDAFYFGILPVLTSIGSSAGISPGDIAQSAMIGEETMGFPISPLTGSFFLLVGLGGVEIGKHIRHLIGWAWLVSLVMLAVAFVTGVIPLWAS